MPKFKIIGLGEVLWDIFPDHRQLGGAPANFAYISTLLGDEGTVASRVGSDDLGHETAARLQNLGLNLSLLQSDERHPTGTVKVELASDGQPSFEIKQPVAWDFLDWAPDWVQAAAEADAVCFGTLAQRGAISRETIQRFLASTKPGAVRVFDINLRQSYYSASVLRRSLEFAEIVKMNHDEVPIAAERLNAPVEDLEFSRWLIAYCGTRLVSITRGANGSVLVDARSVHEHPGFKVEVVDGVGAGDAFTAALLHHYLRGASLSEMNTAANLMGALVAGDRGATPRLTAEQLSKVLHPVSSTQYSSLNSR